MERDRREVEQARLGEYQDLAAPEDDVVIQHEGPDGRERSNFIIMIDLPAEGVREQLWARQLDDHKFEICCIPFRAYGLALGDVVTTNADYAVNEVVSRSGRSTYRAWFGEDHPSEEALSIFKGVKVLTEWYEHLLALDAGDDVLAAQLVEILEVAEKRGILQYETGD